MTIKNSRSITSLQASEDGQEHCASQVGQTADLFAQPASPASPSAPQESNSQKMTSDTSCPTSCISSRSQALTQSLASRLMLLSDLAGQTLYTQRWKEKATPQGLQYWVHTASVPRIVASGCTGFQNPWPTPSTQDNAQIAGQGAASKHPSRGTTLGGAALATGWATPLASDSRGSAGVGKKELPNQVQWIGEQLENSGAQMENTDQYRLNPRFSLWLQGFPIEWAYCAERVTR